MTHDIDLIGYLDGSLSEAEIDTIETHLKTCAECSKEYRLLLKSEQLFASMYKRRPDLLCPNTDGLIQFAAGEISPSEKTALQAHIKDCASCGRKLETLQEAVTAEDDMPASEQWRPLPQDLEARIANGGPQALRQRLKNALMTLKAESGREISALLADVDDLTDRLLAGGREPLPAYALQRDVTMPSQTDLQLRTPPAELNIEIELAPYVLQISADPAGTRIRVTKAGRPVSGITVKWQDNAGDMKSETTDEKGEVITDRPYKLDL